MGNRERQDELKDKRARVTRLLDEKKLDAVLVSSRANFAWLTCGGDDRVAANTECGVATIIASRDSLKVFTTNIEAQRLMDEELGGEGFEVVAVPWHEDRGDHLRRLVEGLKLGADVPFPGALDVGADLGRLRRSLLPAEVARYREVGRSAAQALESACLGVRPGLTEFDAAAKLDAELLKRGLVPNVTLVASDERIRLYRHPIPTVKAIERYVMLVTCAYRWGLVAAATRIVSFGKLPPELRMKHDAVVRVDASMMAATLPGRPAASVFERAVRAYEEVGFPEEWRLHHQGGATGYANREYVATPACKETIADRQAFAWNPSITGTKSEDTIVLNEGRPEVITCGSQDWPLVDVSVDGTVIRRPDILVMS
ncbi:MAG: M24 family metallopeptidase [Firmicutes bacterium]|nr:M24 family metallopeptidase [Bacillota bacterium]